MAKEKMLCPFSKKLCLSVLCIKGYNTLAELLEKKAEILRSCRPGAEKIEQLDEKTYDCVIKQKVGPISVQFKFQTTLVKIDPPTHAEMEGEGEDIGKAGRFVQKTIIDLKEIEGGEVEIF